MIDHSRTAQLLCLLMSAGFLVMGCVLMVFAPNDALIGIFLLIAIVMLTRACLYPRRFIRCRICGAKVRNEVHHQLAHAHEHARRKEQ